MPITPVHSQNSEESSPRSSRSRSSSADSDDTVVQTELLKQLNLPKELDEYSDQGSLSIDDSDNGNSNTSLNSSTLEPTTTQKPDTASIIDPSKVHQSTASSSRHTLVEPAIPPPQKESSSKKNQINEAGRTRHIQPTLRKNTRNPSVTVKKSADMKWTAKIERTKKFHKLVDEEIQRREMLTNQTEITNQIVAVNPGPSSLAETPIVDYGVPTIQSQSSSFKQFEPSTVTSMELQSRINTNGRIPRLILDQSVIEAAIDRIAQRKKFKTAYVSISEILHVKKLLSKGNPFVIIPQFAYDISRVPGIRLAHIQLLLKQWENYFAEYVYQVIQMEYSIEFGDIENRINLMVNGGDKYQIIRDFQACIGQEEVSTKIFGHSSKVQAIEPGPSSKKVRLNDSSTVEIKEKTYSRKHSKKGTKSALIQDPNTLSKSVKADNEPEQDNNKTSEVVIDEFVF